MGELMSSDNNPVNDIPTSEDNQVRKYRQIVTSPQEKCIFLSPCNLTERNWTNNNNDSQQTKSFSHWIICISHIACFTNRKMVNSLILRLIVWIMCKRPKPVEGRRHENQQWRRPSANQNLLDSNIQKTAA